MYKKSRLVALGAAAALVIVGAPVAANAADVSRTGDYTLASGKTISGDLIVRSGNVVVYGTVEGDLIQTGTGSVRIAESGEVDGDVRESGDGNVRVFGEVDGSAVERGDGYLHVTRSGDVGRDAAERDGGRALIGGSVDRNVTETGSGSVVVGDRSEIDGDVVESGPGNLYLYRGAEIDGDARERDAGSIVRR